MFDEFNLFELVPYFLYEGVLVELGSRILIFVFFVVHAINALA
jgi:hypothetical protein